MTESRKPDAQSVDEMQLLRELILGEDEHRLNRLDKRISDIESRTADVAEVLPSAMNNLVGDPVSRPDIERPIVDSIQSAIKRDSQSFAEVLFPVMGPAIRAAVAEALKGLVQRINAALENSFTVKGLKWRLESARTGISFPQIVLRHTMVYAIQEAFLIQRGSGLILASAHRDELLALDEDAVAAMLTAIQSFIQDSFGISNDESLSSAELGDRTVWVVSGPTAALACVITGTPPRAVRAELMETLEIIHGRFGDRLGENPEVLEGQRDLQLIMGQTLFEEVNENFGNGKRSRAKYMWMAAGLLLLLMLAFASFNTWKDRQRADEITELFSSAPGYVITSVENDDGVLKISGLRDPAAEQPGALLDSQQVSAENLAIELRPYQSLDDVMVIRRLERRFGFGPDTSLRLEGNELVVSGVIGSEQLADLHTLPKSHALIRSLNLDGVVFDAEKASSVFREALQAPESVNFVPEDNYMSVSGLAGADWYSTARQVNIDVPGWQLDFSPLEAGLSEQLDKIVQSLNDRVFQYATGSQLSPGVDSLLESAATELQKARQLAGVLSANLNISVEASSDGTGTRENNIQTCKDRSQHLLNELVKRGVNVQDITQTQGKWSPGGENPGLRKVTLMIRRGANP